MNILTEINFMYFFLLFYHSIFINILDYFKLHMGLVLYFYFRAGQGQWSNNMEITQTLKSNEPKSVLSSPAYDLMVVAKLCSSSRLSVYIYQTETLKPAFMPGTWYMLNMVPEHPK